MSREKECKKVIKNYALSEVTGWINIRIPSEFYISFIEPRSDISKM